MCPHGFDLSHRPDDTGQVGLDTVTGHFQHGQCVQGDIGTRPCIRRWRKVVGVGFTGDLEYPQGDFFRQARATAEPLAVGPRVQHGQGLPVTRAGLGSHIVKGVKHQERVLELLGGHRRQFGVIQQLDQGGDVVAALHGTQQLDGASFVN